MVVRECRRNFIYLEYWLTHTAACNRVPYKTSDLGGVGSLYSMTRYTSDIPVATVAINGAKNECATKILAVNDEKL